MDEVAFARPREAGGPALAQLWLFWVAPIIGAAIGGALSKALLADERR